MMGRIVAIIRIPFRILRLPSPYTARVSDRAHKRIAARLDVAERFRNGSGLGPTGMVTMEMPVGVIETDQVAADPGAPLLQDDGRTHTPARAAHTYNDSARNSIKVAAEDDRDSALVTAPGIWLVVEVAQPAWIRTIEFHAYASISKASAVGIGRALKGTLPQAPSGAVESSISSTALLPRSTYGRDPTQTGHADKVRLQGLAPGGESLSGIPSRGNRRCSSRPFRIARRIAG
jgi:hypothetical protein